MKGLLFITDRTVRYDYPDSVRIALEGGCRLIQLRMKDAPTDEVERTAREAKQMCDEVGAQLFIDDHVEVCRRVGAAGVHLGKLDMAPSDAREILGPDFMIGGTANTFEDIRALAAQGVDYIGLGPFRFTTTKKNLSPVLGFEGYREMVDRSRQQGLDLPIYAIGGITPDDIPELMKTGVAGIAASSTILRADDPVAAVRELIERINTNEI